MLSHKQEREVENDDIKPACSVSFTTVVDRVDVGEQPAIIVVVVVIMSYNTIIEKPQDSMHALIGQ